MKQFDLWNTPWLQSVMAAILLWLSFPPYNLGLLQIPAFILLLRLSVTSVSVRQMIYYAYPSFVLWNLFTTYWLMMASVSAGVAAILANAALMLIPLGLIRRFTLSDMNPVGSSFLSATVWVSYEFLHHQWDLAWPWLTLGNAWSNLTGAIQYISVTGIWGVSFWVVFTAALSYHAIKTASGPIIKSTALVFFAFPIFSVLAMINIHQPSDEPFHVTVVQPNSNSYERYGGYPSLDDLVTHLLELSDSARTDSTQLIAWPENALDDAVTLSNPQIMRIRDSLRVWDTELITGSGYLKYYRDEDAPDIIRGINSGYAYNFFNAAFHIQPERPTEVYEKGRLVPVVERFPFVELFNRIDRFGWVNWGALNSYGLGKEATVFQVGEGHTPALICYDSVFPGWVNDFVNNDADFLTIITNDGWWGDSNGHIQHFAYARLRAIEQRRWIARAANNGISGIISPDGKVQLETEYWTEDAFSYKIYQSDKMTFYGRFGDWLPWLSLLSSVVGIGLSFAGRQKEDSNV